MQTQLEIAGIKILLTQKKIRNLHLRVAAPEGEVRVSAPMRYTVAHVKEFVFGKIEWIKKSQQQIQKLRDEGKIKMPAKLVCGEEVFLFGERLRLEVVRNFGVNKVMLRQAQSDIQIYVKGQSNFAQRQKLLDDFYRENLRKIIPELIEKYEKKMSVKVAEFGVKKMKTRWGTCNPQARRIWLALELAKKPLGYLESTVVHEMVHLLERGHGPRFYELMDRFMPDWKKWK